MSERDATETGGAVHGADEFPPTPASLRPPADPKTLAPAMPVDPQVLREAREADRHEFGIEADDEEVAPPTVFGAPKVIFLNVGELDRDYYFGELEEVTWCKDRIGNSDIEYLRSDVAEEHHRELDFRLKRQIKTITEEAWRLRKERDDLVYDVGRLANTATELATENEALRAQILTLQARTA